MGIVFEKNGKGKCDLELSNEELLYKTWTLAFKSMLSYSGDGGDSGGIGGGDFGDGGDGGDAGGGGWLVIIITLLYRLTIEQFLMHPLSICASLCSALVSKIAL